MHYVRVTVESNIDDSRTITIDGEPFMTDIIPVTAVHVLFEHAAEMERHAVSDIGHNGLVIMVAPVELSETNTVCDEFDNDNSFEQQCRDYKEMLETNW